MSPDLRSDKLPQITSSSNPANDEVALERRIVMQLKRAGYDASMPSMSNAWREAAKKELKDSESAA